MAARSFGSTIDALKRRHLDRRRVSQIRSCGSGSSMPVISGWPP